VILKPIIDKLTFGFSPTAEFLAKYDPSQGLKEYKEHIAVMLGADALAEKDGLSVVNGLPMKPPYSYYEYNLRFTPSGSKNSVFIQLAPTKSESKLDFIKFDFNPSHFDKKALAEIRAFIADTFQTATAITSEVTYEDIIASSILRRVHVAIDVLGTRPSDIVVNIIKNGIPFPCKTNTFNSDTGRVETIYLDAKMGEYSKRKVYDKRTEQIESGKTPIYGDCLHSRYESCLNKTTFDKVANIQNPCGRITLSVLDYKRFKKLSHVSRLFMRRAIDRTLDKALEKIPAAHHLKFKQCYNEIVLKAWDAETIWSHWKNAVKSSGLFPGVK
jgi:hypothetical protein